MIRCTFPDGRGGLYLGCDRIILHVDANGGKRIVAGDGFGDSSGDNGPAIDAHVGFIEGLYLDSMGNLFFAEYAKVRRIDTNGIITTVAGDGTAGNDGDGGLATLAHLKKPVGIVMGPDGSLYISDSEANRIRKIDPTGIISTHRRKRTRGVRRGRRHCHRGAYLEALVEWSWIWRGTSTSPTTTTTV